MGKTGKERALDLELRVPGSIPRCVPDILEHMFTYPDSGQTLSLYMSMTEMTCHDGSVRAGGNLGD